MKTNSSTPLLPRAHPLGAPPTLTAATPTRLRTEVRAPIVWRQLRRWHTAGAALGLLLSAGLAKATTYTVTTTADSDAGSLRQAILDANDNPGADIINFNIPGAGLHTISPIIGLPAITDPVTINGYNQADSTSRTEINGALGVIGVFVDGVSYASAPGEFVNGSVSAPLKVVDGDGPGGLSLACDPLPAGSLTGTIALISRNVCFFATKVFNAKEAGAIGVIVVNRDPGVFEMGGLDPNSIPAFMVSSGDRETLIAQDGKPTILAPPAIGLHLASGSDGSTISGLVINRFPRAGIQVDSSGNTISGNFIGTDATGTAASPNGDSAVRIFSPGNTVQENLLSGNVGDGVSLNVGANSILNNKVGSDVTGTVALGNGRVGIWVDQAAGSTIRGNLIAWNGFAGDLPGVLIEGGSPATLIQNNTISGNATDGILLRSEDNLVGGLAPGEGNIIAFNSLGGVGVESPGVNNAILGNSIYDNELLGIDLGLDGVTLNDLLDADAGPNHRQNFPVLDANQSIINPALVIAAGSLSSEPNTDYLVEVFSDDAGGAACVGLADPFISLTGPADVYNVSGAVGNIADAKAAVDAGKETTPFHSMVDSVVLSEGSSGLNSSAFFTRPWPIGNADNFSSGVIGTFQLAADANHNGVAEESILVTFGLFSDDGSQIIIKGTGGFMATGGDSRAAIRTVYTANDALTADFFTGNTNTYGTIMLTEGQRYDFEAYQFEGGWDSGLTIAYAHGDQRGNSSLMVPLATAAVLEEGIPLYTSASCGPQMFLSAEGKHFLGSFAVHTDASGFAAFRQILEKAAPAGQLMTATATKIVGGVPVETSGFSEAVEVAHGGAKANAGGAGGGGNP